MKKFTKNRAHLLRLFFSNVDESYYIHEIARILGKKPGVFQRTLINMEKEGILTSEYRASARFFKVNKQYPLYQELKSIVFKTVGISGSIKEVLSKANHVKLAFIYGSYAKGKEDYLSDIDIIIVGKPDEDLLMKEFDKLEERLKRELNYKLYEPKEFQKEIIRKDPFLMEILSGKKKMLIGDENELRKIHKGTSR